MVKRNTFFKGKNCTYISFYSKHFMFFHLINKCKLNIYSDGLQCSDRKVCIRHAKHRIPLSAGTCNWQKFSLCPVRKGCTVVQLRMADFEWQKYVRNLNSLQIVESGLMFLPPWSWAHDTLPLAFFLLVEFMTLSL